MNISDAIKTKPDAVRAAVINKLNDLAMDYLDETFRVKNKKEKSDKEDTTSC